MQTIATFGVMLAAIAAGPLSQTDQRSADEIVAHANELVTQGAYADAIKEYESAAELKPNTPELPYNKGVALYRLGDYKGAAEAFGGAMDASRPWLDRRARYNLGNCAFAEAMAAQEQDPQAAIERLDTAIGHYRDVLKSDSRDAAARANLERSQILKDKLEEMLQQQQDQQQQQNENNEEQDEQKSSDDQDSQQQQKNEQESDNNQQQDQEQENQQGPQQDQQQENQQDSSQQQDEQKSDQNQQSESKQNKQGDSQQQQSQQDKEGQQEDKGQEAKPKDGDLKESQPQQGDEQQQAEPSDRTLKDGKPAEMKPMKMSEEEAKNLLQMIRDKERARRAQLMRAKQQRQEPVAKDW